MTDDQYNIHCILTMEQARWLAYQQFLLSLSVEEKSTLNILRWQNRRVLKWSSWTTAASQPSYPIRESAHFNIFYRDLSTFDLARSLLISWRHHSDDMEWVPVDMAYSVGGKVRVRVFLKDLIVAIQYLTVRFAYTNQLSLSLRKQIRHSCGHHSMESKPQEMLSMKRDTLICFLKSPFSCTAWGGILTAKIRDRLYWLLI